MINLGIQVRNSDIAKSFLELIKQDGRIAARFVELPAADQFDIIHKLTGFGWEIAPLLPSTASASPPSPSLHPHKERQKQDDAAAAEEKPVERDFNTALALLVKGWTVAGPYLYGSRSRGQKKALRLGNPKDRQVHCVFPLTEQEMARLVGMAKAKGLFRERVMQNGGPPVEEQQKTAAATTAEKGGEARPDLMTPPDNTPRKGVFCTRCKEQIDTYPLNRHAQAIYRQVTNQHYNQTAHEDSYVVGPIGSGPREWHGIDEPEGVGVGVGVGEKK